jgi:hypothetical protein
MKIAERGKIDTSNTPIHDCSFSLPGFFSLILLEQTILLKHISNITKTLKFNIQVPKSLCTISLK